MDLFRIPTERFRMGCAFPSNIDFRLAVLPEFSKSGILKRHLLEQSGFCTYGILWGFPVFLGSKISMPEKHL